MVQHRWTCFNKIRIHASLKVEIVFVVSNLETVSSNSEISSICEKYIFCYSWQTVHNISAVVLKTQTNKQICLPVRPASSDSPVTFRELFGLQYLT